MTSVNVDIDVKGDGISITGDTVLLMRSRRISIFLRDYLKATISDAGEITVPLGEQSVGALLENIEESLHEGGFSATRSARLTLAIEDFERAELQFAEFSRRAREIWHNEIPPPELKTFADTLAKRLPGRTLYNLQLLAAYHLAFAQNAANFSSPGIGKTTIVYGAFAYLNSLTPADPKYVNKILVIGPLSSFGPWEMEFKECFSRGPKSYRLSGGVALDTRKRVLYSELPEYRDAELILTSYQTAANTLEHLEHYLTRPGNRVMVVLDEAHKIKNSTGGVWADAVLELAQYCAARVVLTGTPAPNGYEDLYNLFHFIWPDHDIIKFYVPHLRDMSQNRFDPRIDKLIDNLSPFFLRIRKMDLGLPPTTEHMPTVVPMGPRQLRIYRFIEEQYVDYLQKSREKSWILDTLVRARMIRLMQAATNPSLLQTPLDASLLGEGQETTTATFIDDMEILREIRGYEDHEIPVKMIAAVNLVKNILTKSPENRIVVWCVFIANLFKLQKLLKNERIDSRILYGGTPTEIDTEESDIETRERIVREFQTPGCSYRVIIANPFAVGESISLHKTCHHAVYLERNFNAAAFLQSKDRIHRYGLVPGTETHYHYLLSADSVDGTIHRRLLEKEAAMMRVLESRTIPLISLNMEVEEENEGADDVRAIIRDYVNRRSSSSYTR